jgi:hypothetical protein
MVRMKYCILSRWYSQCMTRKVVRCCVCARVHNLTELQNIEHLPNGTTTFTCPVKKESGSYRLENVGTINPIPVD